VPIKVSDVFPDLGFGKCFYIVGGTDASDSNVVVVSYGEQVFVLVDPREFKYIVHSVELSIQLSGVFSIRIDWIEADLIVSDCSQYGLTG